MAGITKTGWNSEKRTPKYERKHNSKNVYFPGSPDRRSKRFRRKKRNFSANRTMGSLPQFLQDLRHHGVLPGEAGFILHCLPSRRFPYAVQYRLCNKRMRLRLEKRNPAAGIFHLLQRICQNNRTLSH